MMQPATGRPWSTRGRTATRSLTYDPGGNRTLKKIDGPRTTYSYDSANQLKTAQDSAGTTSYSFDADGNQQLVVEPNGDRTTTTRDFGNRPTLYELPAATSVTMYYNTENCRVENDT